MKRSIAVLYGGKSAEHEVSLSTALAVIKAIDFNKYDVYPIYITLDGEWCKGDKLEGPVDTIETLKLHSESKPDYISKFIVDENLQQVKFDCVFPLLHGTNGEDGTVQGLLEVLNVPYVGNGVLASAAGMDKVVMKQLFEIAGLKQVPFIHFLRKEWEKSQQAIIEKCEEQLSWPMFVKPANLGSSVGISKASNQAELIDAVNFALKYDRKIVVEQGVKAREIEMAVLGNDEPKVSVPGEIIPKTEFYDYESKYKDSSTSLVIPAEVTLEVKNTMEDMAIRAFKILDCSGLVRSDFFVTEDNEVLINEVNTMPGFTPVSMYPLLWQNTGVSYPELIDTLIDLAFERYEEKQLLQYKKD